MIFKYETQLIDTENYITGSRLISEKGTPDGEYEFTKPFNQPVLDENSQLQWTIRDNPKYDPEIDSIDDRYLIEHKPISLTSEELQAKQEAQDKAKYVAAMPDLVKTLEARIATLETAKEITP